MTAAAAAVASLGVTFVAAQPAQGTCTLTAGVVTCDLGAIPASGMTTVEVDVHLDDDEARGRFLKIMADESLKPEGDMPFSGKRMFWGGFETIHDTARQRESAVA